MPLDGKMDLKAFNTFLQSQESAFTAILPSLSALKSNDLDVAFEQHFARLRRKLRNGAAPSVSTPLAVTFDPVKAFSTPRKQTKGNAQGRATKSERKSVPTPKRGQVLDGSSLSFKDPRRYDNLDGDDSSAGSPPESPRKRKLPSRSRAEAAFPVEVTTPETPSRQPRPARAAAREGITFRRGSEEDMLEIMKDDPTRVRAWETSSSEDNGDDEAYVEEPEKKRRKFR